MIRHFLAFALATLGVAAIVSAAQGSSAGANGFSVRATAAGEARVAAPADSFPCRLTAAGNRDVVQLGIGRGS